MPIFIDPASFGIGFVIGIVFWMLVGRMRPAFKEWREGAKTRSADAQERRSTGIEDNHRRSTLRRAQGMHLAAPLFALNEILQPPRLIAPPPHVVPGDPLVTEDIVTQTLPYMPSWPELATIYGAPTLSLTQALSGGSNIVLIGMDGIGKTVALAHLATLAANRDPRLGDLSEMVPFLVHAADLNLPVKDLKEILNPIVDFASENISVLDLGRMPDFIRYVFKNGRALLLLDGFDELAPEGQQAITEFLRTLRSAYPKARMVATALPEQMNGLLGLGFAPLALMGWDTRQQTDFTRKWGEQWTRFINAEAWAQSASYSVDPILLETWLGSGNQHLTPLELTLKVWGGFAGDSLGPRVLDAIASHVRRVAPADTPPAALETLAMQVVLSVQPVFDPRKARDWVRSFEAVEEKSVEGDPDAEGGVSRTGPLGQKSRSSTIKAPSSSLLGKMTASGLLLSHPGNRMRFLHPVFAGYLAGRALSAYNAEEKLLAQSAWGGKLLAIRYLAAYGDVTRILENLLQDEDPMLQRPLFHAARWLRDAPRDSAWRGKIMAGLARVLQTENNPRGLRGQAMAAFALCGDPGAAAFFRQSLQSLSFELIPLAALGSGAIQDAKALELLATTMSAPSNTARYAACLALVAIGTPAALEAVARALLSGDDDLRRAAAEALANDEKEGRAMLRDGATLSDILVRRAVIYGLARVDEPWAVETIKRIQVEDDQWIVRNAATEVLDSKAHPSDKRVPRPLTPPSGAPWLIEFAGRQGVGIVPGALATDILLSALNNGDMEERLASLPYLRSMPGEGTIRNLYNAIRSDDSEMREAAYQTIWEMGSGGTSLPVPAKFGPG